MTTVHSQGVWISSKKLCSQRALNNYGQVSFLRVYSTVRVRIWMRRRKKALAANKTCLWPDERSKHPLPTGCCCFSGLALTIAWAEAEKWTVLGCKSFFPLQRNALAFLSNGEAIWKACSSFYSGAPMQSNRGVTFGELTRWENRSTCRNTYKESCPKLNWVAEFTYLVKLPQIVSTVMCCRFLLRA